MTFEENLARLEAIAQSLERDDLPLEKALALFEEGITVLKGATESLSRAEARVATLVERANGVLEVEHDDD
jgi:exodeoxyribonuclease VII small subunit